MIEPIIKTQFTFKGIHYLDLIARNIQKGGIISDLTVISQDNLLFVSIKTTYADGLTNIIEELKYENGLLISWALKALDTQHTIFSRDVLSEYINI